MYRGRCTELYLLRALFAKVDSTWDSVWTAGLGMRRGAWSLVVVPMVLAFVCAWLHTKAGLPVVSGILSARWLHTKAWSSSLLDCFGRLRCDTAAEAVLVGGCHLKGTVTVSWRVCPWADGQFYAFVVCARGVW